MLAVVLFLCRKRHRVVSIAVDLSRDIVDGNASSDIKRNLVSDNLSVDRDWKRRVFIVVLLCRVIFFFLHFHDESLIDCGDNRSERNKKGKGKGNGSDDDFLFQAPFFSYMRVKVTPEHYRPPSKSCSCSSVTSIWKVMFFSPAILMQTSPRSR